MVRLVKGAYWDTEIKRAQEHGLDTYPVFTRKVATDVSYLACAKRMFAAGPAFYPQFATHNAHTVAAILEMGGERTDWEYQRLHGMGEALYTEIVGPDKPGRPCRVYAPVGSHEDLLAYLVRRLLENGANTSFVNRLVDEREPIDEIIADPVARLARLPYKPHPAIPLPRDIFQPARRNSQGIDLADPRSLSELQSGLAAAARRPWTVAWTAGPIVGGIELTGTAEPVFDPADRRRELGTVSNAARRRGQRRWSARPTATSATGPS
jgi:RHH-type proline utilization regulon transcriptional repressor/proline dehydrogenase/delta 1-pyrroline-5-carboxylate dehydrogenase